MKLVFVLLIVLIIIRIWIYGNDLIEESAHISENVLPQNYRFVLDGNYAKMIFDDFLLQYNFSTKNGSITFVLGGYEEESKILSIYIITPLLINNSKLIIETFNCKQGIFCTNKSTMGFKYSYYNKSEERETEIIIDNFNRPFHKNEKVVFNIKFSSEIEPSGTFRLDNLNLIRAQPYYRINSRIYDMDLNFGDTYVCSFNCFEPSDGIQYYESDDKHFFIKFNQSIKVHEFKLNFINAKNLFNKNHNLALGVSLLAGIVTGIAILLLDLIIPFSKNKNNFDSDFIKKLVSHSIKIRGVGTKTLNKIKKELDNFQKRK